MFREETWSLPPPVRYLGLAATRLEGPPAMARTAMFCRIPVPGAGTSPLPGPDPSSGLVGPAAEVGTAPDVLGAFRPAAHTFLRALPSHKGQLLEFPSASLDPDVQWLRGKIWSAQATRAMATGVSLARFSHE